MGTGVVFKRAKSGIPGDAQQALRNLIQQYDFNVRFCLIEGQLFWDYLKKIDEKTDVSDDDSTNNNIVNENKQITKTLTDMLEHGNLVPDVSKFTALLF